MMTESYTSHSAGEQERIINSYEEKAVNDTERVVVASASGEHSMRISTSGEHSMHLSLGADHDTSNMASLMNVIKGNLGTGILAMPVAIKNMGLVLGTLSILFIGVIATHCMHVLLRCAKKIRDRDGIAYLDYADLMSKACLARYPFRISWARHLKNFVNVSLLITQIGFCCCYILFIADNLRSMVGCFMGDTTDDELAKDKRNLDIHLYKFFVLLLLIPYVFVRNLRLLSYFSTLANITTAIGLVIVFVYCIQNIDYRDGKYPYIEKVNLWPVSFGIIIFAFEGISLVLPIEASMKTPRDFHGFSGVLQLGMTLVICLYTSVGFYGYLKFGADVMPSITLNIPCDSNPAHVAVKPLFVFALFISYGLQFYVPAEILTAMMKARISNPRYWLLGDAAVRIGIAVFTFAAAATIPHLDLMIALIGAFSSSCLALIFPALIESFMTNSTLTLTKNILIGGFGLIGFFIGTVTTIYQIVQAFREDYA